MKWLRILRFRSPFKFKIPLIVKLILFYLLFLILVVKLVALLIASPEIQVRINKSLDSVQLPQQVVIKYGAVTITNTGMQQNGLLLDGSGIAGNINNLTINLTSATASNNTIEFSPSLVLDNNLTITAGKLQPYSSSYALTVTGIMGQPLSWANRRIPGCT